jgi:hypothetical protein
MVFVIDMALTGAKSRAPGGIAVIANRDEFDINGFANTKYRKRGGHPDKQVQLHPDRSTMESLSWQGASSVWPVEKS